jgi:hypothetical protein
MHALLGLLLLISAVSIVVCIVWLHWRALQDGAIHDVLLFLTGLSILSYVVSRWGRAKGPILGLIGASVVLAIVATMSTMIGAPSHEPSAEKLAAEVKPLILQEWRKNPDLAKAMIQSVALVHKGEGYYWGYLETTLDGHSERLALEVVLDRESIKWEIKPEAK